MSAHTGSRGRRQRQQQRQRAGTAPALRAATPERELARRRTAIDRLNRELRDLLQRRARLTLDVAAWKRARGLAVVDPARERDMIERLLADPGPGFDRETLARLLRSVFGACRRLAVRGDKEIGNP